MESKITIITPTTGKKSLYKLIESLDAQTVPFNHIILWDGKREDDYLYPDPVTLKAKDPYCFNSDNRYSIVIPSSFVNGVAAGSSLRSLGLMAATTPYVTFADDDVWFEPDHLSSMLNTVQGRGWAYCKRRIWSSDGINLDNLGVDDFESVGDSASKKVPYEMVDNNCMIFNRRFGTSGAVLYRETTDYNDDRLFYAFLKQHAGVPGKTNLVTVNQVCPKRLEPMFRQNCTRV